VADPHDLGVISPSDEAARVFGTREQSSRLLISDAFAEGGWTAARLHMHAEDEFSAGSFESAKRDAMRLLSGEFRVRFLIEGRDAATVDPIVEAVERLVALGAIGHLPIGGHKTRGAGWGRWKKCGDWKVDDVPIDATLANQVSRGRPASAAAPQSNVSDARHRIRPFLRSLRRWPHLLRRHPRAVQAARPPNNVHVFRESGVLTDLPRDLTAALAAKVAKEKLVGSDLTAWWCEPAIDFSASTARPTFGRAWPGPGGDFPVDEIAFFTKTAAWRAARTAGEWRFTLVKEVDTAHEGNFEVQVIERSVELHADTTRFSATATGQGSLTLRQWVAGQELIAFTLCKVGNDA